MSDGLAFHTPDYDGNAPVVCRRLALPSFLWPLFNGAFGELLDESRWYQFGDMPIGDVIQAFHAAFDDMGQCSMIGQIVMFAGELPDNVLLCDGEEYDGAEYPDLYAILPPSLIVGNSFQTPNLSGRFILASGNSYNPGDTGGEEKVTLTVEQIPSHFHDYVKPIPNIDVESPGAPDLIAAGVGPLDKTSAEGGGGPHNNMPPYYVLVYGIVAK